MLRQVVAEELERLADADERLRLLTVTAVDTSPDLRNATVYLGTLGDEAAEALEERRAQLQAHVGREVRLKRTPRLTFAADPGGERRRAGRGGAAPARRAPGRATRAGPHR